MLDLITTKYYCLLTFTTCIFSGKIRLHEKKKKKKKEEKVTKTSNDV
jgi:hypothetical protein